MDKVSSADEYQLHVPRCLLPLGLGPAIEVEDDDDKEIADAKTDCPQGSSGGGDIMWQKPQYMVRGMVRNAAALRRIFAAIASELYARCRTPKKRAGTVFIAKKGGN